MNTRSEAGKYAADDVARVIERNFSEYQVAMGTRLQDSEVQIGEDIVCVITNAPFHMYNGVFQSRFRENEVIPTIRQIQSKFKERHVPFVWQLGPTTHPIDLADTLLEHGFSHYEDEPAMGLDLTHWDETSFVSANFNIKHVSQESELHDWVSVWAFDANADVISQLYAVHQDFGFHSESPWTYYVGYEGGVPVATSLLFRGSEAVAVHWVVTIPETRKKGYGRAMTVATLREAKEAGYSLAVLTASPEGKGIYTKLGFQEYYTVRKYLCKA